MTDEQMQSVCPWKAQCDSEADRIAALERDLAAAQADVREHIALCLAANKLIDKARADLAAALADAERYRRKIMESDESNMPPFIGLARPVPLEIANQAINAAVADASAILPCGHHHSLMLKSAETGEPLYCELCDCISRRNDFETERDEARAEAAALREQYGRVRDAFHVNMLRAYPELSHADIDAAIDAARGGNHD